MSTSDSDDSHDKSKDSMSSSFHTGACQCSCHTNGRPHSTSDLYPRSPWARNPELNPFDSENENEKQDPSSPEETQEGYEDGKINGRSKAKVAIIMVALSLAVFLAALDATIVTTALPTIVTYFDAPSGYTWIGAAYLLANASSAPIWAKISDIFGRKPMLLLANAVFIVGSLIAGLAKNIGMLIGARVLQGLGAGGLTTLVNIVIGDLIPLRSRGNFYGIIGATWAVASSSGPIIGGALTQTVSWRWCFYLNLPIDGLAFIVLLFFLDVKTPKTPIWEGLKAIDWVGAVLAAGGTLMFLIGLQFGGQTAPWTSAMVICLLVFGLVTFALFLGWDWTFPSYPIMPVAIFATVTNCATLLVSFVHGVVFIGGTYYLPLFFQVVLGATPILSGVYLLPTALSVAAGSIITGVGIAKTGKFLPAIFGAFFFITLGYGLFIDYRINSSWAKIIIYQIVAGFGMGPLFQAPLVALQAHTKPRDLGTATAALGFIRAIGTTLGVVIGDALYSNEFSSKIAQFSGQLNPQQIEAIGASPGSSLEIINALPPMIKTDVQSAFANSLHPMWIFYCALAGGGILVTMFIKRKELTAEHEETETGLEAEKANAEARRAEKEAKQK